LDKVINVNPAVSVIINCFNGDKYLYEAINSIYKQTYKDWEIIFWDNQSTDDSAKIAQSFDHRVRYFLADEHTSLGGARKNALKKTNGKLIAFLDCDDLWFENKLELQVKKMESDNFSLCYGGCVYIAENGDEIRTISPNYKDGEMFENLLFHWDINMPSILIRKQDLLDFNLNFDENIYASEEYCLFMQLAVTTKFCVINQPIVKWRATEISLTSEQISKHAYERRYTLNKIINNHPGIELKYKEGFQEAFARADYYDASYYMSLNNRKKARKSLKKIKNLNFKYYILYLILFLPSFFWNSISNLSTLKLYLQKSGRLK
jgi:glycosyltransferase involved in cell wall biosynthesis